MYFFKNILLLVDGIVDLIFLFLLSSNTFFSSGHFAYQLGDTLGL